MENSFDNTYKSNIPRALHKKYDLLNALISRRGSMLIAFSGGVDSSLLLKAAADVLGGRVLAVTAHSPIFPGRELKEAKLFCRDRGIPHEIICLNESDIDGFLENPKNRCYLCKRGLYTSLLQHANRRGIACVAEGSNTDDLADYRPGFKAIEELGILSPLMEVCLSKDEIRLLSKELGLPTWNKPALACLSSRFVYGEPITKERLRMVERAEQLLYDLGFSQFRVRIHGDMARIELLPKDFELMISPLIREQVLCEFSEYGFSYVSMDLRGYKSGSMNKTLSSV